ncbi:unnamed protein product [Hanseniaspora opuntiae]
MSTNDNQDKKHKQYAMNFIKKGRYFSPKISTLIVLNILALVNKVSAIHNWNETSSNSSLGQLLHKGVSNQSEFTKSFNSSYQEFDSSPLFHLFSDVNTYGRNKAEDMISEEQEALVNEPLEGFKVLNYDELNRLIDEVISTTSETTSVVSIPTLTTEPATSHMNATSTFFYEPSSNTKTSEVSSVQDFSTITSFYNETSDSTTSFISSMEKSSTKKSKLETFTPTKTVDTPHWLLDSVATSDVVSKTTMASQRIPIKNKPVFLRAKKFSNKNMMPDTNSTSEPNSRSIGLNDIFESKGSILNKAISMVAIFTLSYLIFAVSI